jgi:hypothetical protein
MAEILEKQQQVRGAWKDSGEIPPACRQCSWYVADQAAATDANGIATPQSQV